MRDLHLTQVGKHSALLKNILLIALSIKFKFSKSYVPFFYGFHPLIKTTF